MPLRRRTLWFGGPRRVVREGGQDAAGFEHLLAEHGEREDQQPRLKPKPGGRDAKQRQPSKSDLKAADPGEGIATLSQQTGFAGRAEPKTADHQCDAGECEPGCRVAAPRHVVDLRPDAYHARISFRAGPASTRAGAPDYAAGTLSRNPVTARMRPSLANSATSKPTTIASSFTPGA